MSATTDKLTLMCTFVRIVAAGNLSAAARQLNSTQPTVSRQLRLLETHLGTQLLNRSTHAISLTDAGARYHEYARGLLEEMQAVEGQLRGESTAPTGSLRVVVPTAFGQDWLVDVAAQYLAEYPEVDIEWRLSEAPVRFAEQAVDCIVRVGPPKEETAVARQVGEVPRLLVAAPSLLARFGPIGEPDDLSRLPWLALMPYYRDRIVLLDRDGATRQIAVAPCFVTDHVLAMRSAARRGSGAALISEWSVRDDIERGSLVRLLPAWRGEPVPVYLIYPKTRYTPAKLRRFIEIVKATVPARLAAVS